MRQAVLTVPEVCSWKPHTGNKQSYSREMMAAKSSSLEAGTTDVALPWHIVQTPASSQANWERINHKMCMIGPHCNKTRDSFCSPSVYKRMQTRLCKGNSSAWKINHLPQNTELKSQISVIVRSFMDSIIPMKPSLNTSSRCKMIY